MCISIQIYSQYSVSNSQLVASYGDTLELSDKSKTPTLFDVRKNSVCIDFLIYFPALGYSRIFPLRENIGIVASANMTPYFEYVYEFSGGVLIGKKNKFFEPQAVYWLRANNFMIKLGYRFQGDKGFVFKLAPAWSFSNNMIAWTLGFGYSFNLGSKKKNY